MSIASPSRSRSSARAARCKRAPKGGRFERSTYDETGLVVRRDHLDAEGHPVLTKTGAASTTLTYDDRGNLIEETALGLDGKPTVMLDGYATKKSTYNERDELVGESFFGIAGEPATGAQGGRPVSFATTISAFSPKRHSSTAITTPSRPRG